MKKLLILFLCLYSTQSIAGPHAFNDWRQHGMRKLDTQTFNIENAGMNINVTFFTDNPDVASVQMYFDEVAEATYRYLSSQIVIGRGTRLGRCHNWRIVVYDLESSNINSRSVMYWYPWSNAAQRLYGAYDSLHTSTNDTAAIIIRSDISNLERKRTLAHELTHYWYDMCVSDGPGEVHAQNAEQLFQ